jgi:cysteinyl-tRNA synthetase
MHNEWLDFRGQKMSKSLGNVYLLDDVVADGHPPLAFRYFFLQAHYRKQQTFNDDAMEAAATGYRRLLASAVEVREAEGEADSELVEPHRARFRAAVRDDLNGPQALAVASEVARDSGLSAADRRTLLLEFDEWLGLDLGSATLPEAAQESDPRIDDLVAKREEARRRRDWAEADRIRDALVTEGVVIEDTPEGPRWRRR